MQFLDALLSILITRATAIAPAGARHAIDHLVMARDILRSVATTEPASPAIVKALTRDIDLIEHGPQPPAKPKPCCGDSAARFGGQP